MRELRDDLLALRAQREPFALALVTSTWSSAPRGVGAAMAVSRSGEAIGSVSGGCVEGAVYDVALEVLSSGQAVQVSFGVSDDEAFAVGLTCGGSIALHVLRVDESNWRALEAVLLNDSVEVGLIAPLNSTGALIAFSESGPLQTTGDQRLDDALHIDAAGYLQSGRSGVIHLGVHGERRPDETGYLVLSFLPPPRMYVFGAIDFARAVADVGVFLGFHTIVCDARSTFATPRRFPSAAEVIVEWPHRLLERVSVGPRDVICVLTHDPKFDVPLLRQALQTPAAYIGVMGSRRTHARRVNELRSLGVSDSDLARVRAPIGLDLGSRTPEETAISIAAEIIKERWGGSGAALSETEGPIHR